MELKTMCSQDFDRPVCEDGRPGTESKQSFVQNNTAGAKRRYKNRIWKLEESLAIIRPDFFILKV